MISNRALQRSFCRKGFFYKAGINRSTLTNRTNSGFAALDSNVGPQMLAYPNMTSEVTMKTDTVELDAILEEIRSNDDFALHHKLADEVALVSSQVVNKRKLDLLYAEPELHTALSNAHQTSLLTRQIKIEEEQQNAAVVHYNEALKQLITMGRGTGLKYIQRVLLKWYEPLTRVLDAEISLIESRVLGPDRTVSTRVVNSLYSVIGYMQCLTVKISDWIINFSCIPSNTVLVFYCCLLKSWQLSRWMNA
jgi:DNA-directed RNA polymerase N-terminal